MSDWPVGDNYIIMRLVTCGVRFKFVLGKKVITVSQNFASVLMVIGNRMILYFLSYTKYAGRQWSVDAAFNKGVADGMWLTK